MDNWQKFAKATYKIEQQFAPLFQKEILHYRVLLIHDIRQNGIQATLNAVSSSLPQADMAPILQKLYRKAGLLGAQMSYREIRQAVRGKKGHDLVLQTKRFGFNDEWIQAVLDYLRINLLQLAQAITETMRKDVLNILTEGIENGWGIDKMVEGMQATGLIKTRARVIARTETVRAANVGHSIGAQSLPYEVNKIWIAARDHRTRHSHRLANGMTVDEHGTFSVPVYKGDKPIGMVDQMQFPGDATASASNTINCRCRVIYEPKTDAQGRTIPRSGTQPALIIPLRPVQSGTPAQIAAALKKAIHIGIDTNS